MNPVTTIHIRRIERSVRTERARAISAIVGVLGWTILAIFNLLCASMWSKDYPEGVFNVMAFIVLIAVIAYDLKTLISSKLRHTELVAELLRLRTIHDKGC